MLKKPVLQLQIIIIYNFATRLKYLLIYSTRCSIIIQFLNIDNRCISKIVVSKIQERGIYIVCVPSCASNLTFTKCKIKIKIALLEYIIRCVCSNCDIFLATTKKSLPVKLIKNNFFLWIQEDLQQVLTIKKLLYCHPLQNISSTCKLLEVLN